tara:strand:+ start:1207 stop:1977 length:771 start_codon:yes stop_codon:yes gene_type:complete
MENNTETIRNYVPFDAGFHEDTLIWMADGTEKAIKDLKSGDVIRGYDTNFPEDEFPGFNGSNVVLNPLQTGTVKEIIEKEVDTLYKLTLNYGMELLVEPESVTYARALPCGPVEHNDGSITEGCASEEKNNGIEGSTAKYEQHACCNVGWMALDLEKSIGKYGEFDEEINPWGTINPNTWCGLDDGSGIYANDEKILDEQTLASMNEEKNYHVEKCEEVKGNFKVYNMPLIDDLQLIYANSVVMGAGQVFWPKADD